MKKKICLISPKFFEYIGGMETHAYEFVKGFSQNNDFELTSIITQKDVKDGIPVMKKERSNLKIPIIKKLTADFNSDLKAILENSPKDTNIYFFNSTNWLPVIEPLKKARKNASVIVRSGGTDLVAGWIGDENHPSQNLAKNRSIIVNIINKYVNSLIVNSNFSKKRFLDLGIQEEKMNVITGGVDCDRFKPIKEKNGAERITVLHASRFVKCKGIDLAINAFGKVLTKIDKKMEFNIIGDGPERSFLEKEVIKNNLVGQVKFFGAVNIEKMARHFNSADIFLHLPITLVRKERGGEYTHVESMGRVFCEASASGVPSIAFSVGGVSEVVEKNKTGFLLKEGDIDGVVEKLVLLSNNVKLRRVMGEKAREKALKEFDWKIIFKKYEEIFRK